MPGICYCHLSQHLFTFHVDCANWFLSAFALSCPLVLSTKCEFNKLHSIFFFFGLSIRLVLWLYTADCHELEKLSKAKTQNQTENQQKCHINSQKFAANAGCMNHITSYIQKQLSLYGNQTTMCSIKYTTRNGKKKEEKLKRILPASKLGKQTFWPCDGCNKSPMTIFLLQFWSRHPKNLSTPVASLSLRHSAGFGVMAKRRHNS